MSKDKIYRMEFFTNGQFNIQHRVNISEKGDNEYVGKGQIMMKTEMGTVPFPFEFPIEAKNLQEAFDNYVEAYKKYAKITHDDVVKEMQENAKKLIIPNATPIPSKLIKPT